MSEEDGLPSVRDVRKKDPNAPATDPTTGRVATRTDGTFDASACNRKLLEGLSVAIDPFWKSALLNSAWPGSRVNVP